MTLSKCWVPSQCPKIKPVCRGEHLLTPAIEKDLKCYISHLDVPYLRIAPFKIEVLSSNPPVVLHREFISQAEADDMVNKAKSVPKEDSLGQKTRANVRMTQKVMDRIHFAIMSKAMSPKFEVVEYGFGDLDEAHQSQAPLDVSLMAYLSDVEAGGATVFPLIGISSWPKKGDMILW